MPLGGDLDPAEIVLAVTTLAMPSEVPSMDVVTTMTGETGLGRRHGALHRTHMTVLAGQAAVFPPQREFALSIVIETPDTPAVRRMTPPAATTQAPLVDVVAIVTVPAGPSRPAIAPIEMTVLAGGRRMQAEQRKTRQGMVESNPLPPAVGIMAPGAVPAEPAVVHVVRPMTGPTTSIELAPNIAAFVASDAVDLAMPPEEGIVGIPIVTET